MQSCVVVSVGGSRRSPPSQCGEHGHCVNQPGIGYKCQCQPGYTGKYCHESMSLTNLVKLKIKFQILLPNRHQRLQSKPLRKRRNLRRQSKLVPMYLQRRVGRSAVQYKYVIITLFGFSPFTLKLVCITDSDDCTPNPCRNNGTCIDRIADFECNCKNGWKGKTCTLKDSHCDHSTCKNGGTCQDLGNSFMCRCPPDWEGTTCHIAKQTACTSNPCSNGGKLG